MRKVLPEKFFKRDTKQVAEDLLGKFLVCSNGKKEMAGKIVEVEVYDGFRDKASHASRGKTPQTETMFGPAGYWYVYLCYGIHEMLNIVTREEGYPAAILIRGIELGSERINGPGRTTRQLGINRARHNKGVQGVDTGLWIEDRGAIIKKGDIHKAPRVGISYAGAYWSKRKLKFYIK